MLLGVVAEFLDSKFVVQMSSNVQDFANASILKRLYLKKTQVNPHFFSPEFVYQD
jgi:hypothetical protein